MRQFKVNDVMTTDVVSVKAEAPYQEIVNTLATHHVSAVPVVDDFKRVLGVVSEADLLHKVEFIGEDTERRIFEWGTKKVHRAKANAATAQELMTTPAVTIQPGSSVVTAAKRLDDEGVKRLPVVDEMGHLVGVVSRSDLLKMYLRPDTELRQEIIEEVLRRMLWIDPVAVQVDVTEGIVTLNGEVDRKSTAHIAVYVIKTVPGVIQVTDKLTYAYDDTRVAATTGL